VAASAWQNPGRLSRTEEVAIPRNDNGDPFFGPAMQQSRKA
jgi:hypothetical protein